MATQVDFQASPTMQENPPQVKKRKRASNSDDMSPAKRGNLQEVNGNGLSSNETPVPETNSFSDPSSASNFPPHPQSQHDEASSNMIAALQAHGQMGNYTGHIEQQGFEMGSPTQGAPQPYMQAYQQHTPTGQAGVGSDDASGLRKPEVGTDEWHKVRRDNHKEVERRRRETINEGINELARIVPGSEKNKGSVLQRTVQELTTLRARVEEYERQGNLSNNVLEQAVRELSSANDNLKHNLTALEADNKSLKDRAGRYAQRLREMGETLDDDDDLPKFES